MRVKLIEHTPNPDRLVTMAAKLCYSNVGVEEISENLTQENIDKFLNMLMKLGHESPVEHVSFTFGVEGVSRVLTHQLVRHRIGCSYSQQSQRYVKLDQFEYIIPPEIEKIPIAKDLFIEAMEQDQRVYDKLVDTLILNQLVDYWHCEGVPSEEVLKHGIQQFEEFKQTHKKIANQMEKKAIEDARYVFPNACETKIVFTMTARALLNFFSHRCCNRAQWEIREMAHEMLKQVKEVAPILFSNAGAECLKGKCPEGSMTCGNPYRKESV
jgi:thymidylate synthase (FAD)